MKIALTKDVVLKVLSVDKKPVGIDSKNRIVFQDNPSRTPYIVYDASESAPPGFGVRIANKKTYILRRKIHGKSVQPTVGNVADFPDLASAREKAARLALMIVDSGGANPNAQAAKIAAGEITLGQAFASHRHHLVTRPNRKVKETTLAIFDRAVKRFDDAGWTKRRVRDITTDEILRMFDERRISAPTANEQNFRYATAAVEARIEQEAIDAGSQRRVPTLAGNPFYILNKRAMYRDRAELEEARKKKRNPLGPMTSMGSFLEAAWSKRNTNDNLTGCDSFILSLLWGTRKSEHVSCMWGDLLSDDDRLNTSHVWLENSGKYGPYVFFAASDVKNKRAHRLPLVGMALELVRRRRVASAEESARRGFDRKARKWVFPAKSPSSKTGHYSDGSVLLKIIAGECGLDNITPHDLRRSFGAAMTAISVPGGIKSRFFNHAGGVRDKDEADVTATYAQPEWALLVEWMSKIEQCILATAPNVFNSLKPVDWPPLAAPEPHVCAPAKPRTGRPRKDSGVGESEASGD
jgi:integrase